MSKVKVSSSSKKIKKSSSSSSKKQKKKSPHERSSSSVQKSRFNRIYRDDDVIKILEAVSELPAEDSSREPNVAAGLILEGIQKSMTIKISQTQLSDKLRKLRKKYCQDRMKSSKLTTLHEERVFDLCNKIWVGEMEQPEKKKLRSTDDVDGKKQQIQELQNYLKQLELKREYVQSLLNDLASSSKAEDDVDDEQAVAVDDADDEPVGDPDDADAELAEDDDENEQSENVDDDDEEADE